MPARLKVFVTSDGLTDYVVAASSRPKALAAWGANQDLFKEGRASETDDAALAKAARAKPGEVLTRPAHAAGAPKLPKPPARKAAGPSAAGRRQLAVLVKRLATLEAGHAAAADGIATARAALDRREKNAEEAFETARRDLERQIASARRR
jgi:hypothetical protein